MEWIVAPRPTTPERPDLEFGPHRHVGIEDVFVIRRGTIEFLLGEMVFTLGANDVVRVPAGTRHGYLNCSGEDVEMLVCFAPGGLEERAVQPRGELGDAGDHDQDSVETTSSARNDLLPAND
jgi:mannose-6-phosphate isomerase-like protein (cupin superfamily)